MVSKKPSPLYGKWYNYAYMDNLLIDTLLETYGLSVSELKAALPRVVCSLSSDELALLDGVDVDMENTETMTEPQRAVTALLLVRAAALAFGEKAERTHKRSDAN
jgi:hypothetical protein